MEDSQQSLHLLCPLKSSLSLLPGSKSAIQFSDSLMMDAKAVYYSSYHTSNLCSPGIRQQELSNKKIIILSVDKVSDVFMLFVSVCLQSWCHFSVCQTKPCSCRYFGISARAPGVGQICIFWDWKIKDYCVSHAVWRTTQMTAHHLFRCSGSSYHLG